MDSNSSNVRVCVRIRPENDSESQSSGMIAVRPVDKHVLVFDPDEKADPTFFHGKPLKGRDPTKRKPRDLKFAFDRVFDAAACNEEVYEDTTKGLLDALLSGYNCSVFAYGATGAGKTFTMLGKPGSPGVIFYTMMDLYKVIESRRTDANYDVAVSYMEVYNEQVKDLLVAGNQFLPLREDPQRGVIIQGLSLHKPQTAEELLHMLDDGNKHRTQHPTDANAESSRSHAVFQVFVRQSSRAAGVQAAVNVGKMSLIDLAGSERATVTKNRGDRLREGANINRSLLALGNCINALADNKKKGQQHVPYRDSKLTRILKDSLGGNCRTVMIAAVSPSKKSFEDTYNTLRYADRAKHIKAEVKRNIVSVDQHILRYSKIIEELKVEVTELKSRLKEHENGNLTAARTLPSTAPANPKTAPSQDLTRHVEMLKEVFAERSVVREALLTAESQQHAAQYAILRKEAALERLHVFNCDDNSGTLTPTAVELDSRIQHAISIAKKREYALGQKRCEVSVKVKANIAKLRRIMGGIPVDSCDHKSKEALDANLQCQHLAMALNDSKQHVKHLRRLARLQDKENQANERLIAILLRALRQHNSALQSCGLPLSNDLHEAYSGVLDLLSSDRSVGFAEDPESHCSGSDTVGETTGREAFSALLDLSVYRWPCFGSPSSLENDPGATTPTSGVRGKMMRSPLLKQELLCGTAMADASPSACSALQALAAASSRTHHFNDLEDSQSSSSGTVTSSAKTGANWQASPPRAGHGSSVDSTHFRVQATAKVNSPMDTDHPEVHALATAEHRRPNFSTEVPFSRACLNETLTLSDCSEAPTSGACLDETFSLGLATTKESVVRPFVFRAPSAICAKSAEQRSSFAFAGLASASNSAPDVQRLADVQVTSFTKCWFAAGITPVSNFAVSKKQSAEAHIAEASRIRTLPRRVALGSCSNTPPPAASSGVARKATVFSQAAQHVVGAVAKSPFACPTGALLLPTSVSVSEDENSSDAHNTERSVKRMHSSQKPGYMQMTRAASSKKARLDFGCRTGSTKDLKGILDGIAATPKGLR